jgi:hypothetical protein
MLIAERPPRLQAFLRFGPAELRELRASRPAGRNESGWTLDEVALESLIRVLERRALQSVAQLGADAAAAWATRVGIS